MRAPGRNPHCHSPARRRYTAGAGGEVPRVPAGWSSAIGSPGPFDYNRNGRIDFADVVWRFNRL